jgi:hypothetical protein
MDLSTMDVEIPAADAGDVADDIEISTDTATEEGTTDSDSTDADITSDVDGEDVTDVKVEAKPDGRSIPAKYRDLFKTDKDLRGMYFQAGEFKKHFESPAKAAETLEQLNALGGFEGIASTTAEFAEIDKMFSTGDKTLLDKFLSVEGNKEGFAKLGPALFEEYRKSDEGAWTHDIAKVMASTLQQAGVGQDINTLAGMLKDNPEALAVLKKINSLVSGIDQLAAAKPKPTVDPEREKLNKDRADFEKSRSDLFLQGVNNGIGVHIEKGIKDSLQPYIKNRNLDKESYALIESNVGSELNKLMQADAQFTSQKDAVLKSGDKERIQKFFNSKITKYLPDACKKVMRAFGSVGSSSAATTQSKSSTAVSGVIKLSKAPEASEIDYRKSGSMIMDSKAILKNGKTVTWD